MPGFHIRDALSVVAAAPGLDQQYGGHAMAAGLTLPDHSRCSVRAFDAEVRRQLREEDLTGRMLSDGNLAVESFIWSWRGPYCRAVGTTLPRAVVPQVFQPGEQRIVGERHLKVVLKTECGSVKLDGIAFRIDREVWPNPTIRWVELAYKLDLNEFRGNETVAMIAHIEPR